MALVKVLEMDFLNASGKTVTIRVADPREDLTPAQVSAAMDTIISSNVFQTAGGDLVSKQGAQVVSREISEILG